MKLWKIKGDVRVVCGLGRVCCCYLEVFAFVFSWFHSNSWFECVISDPNRVLFPVSFYLFWSFSALYSSLTISDDLPKKACEKRKEYWQFLWDRRVIPTYLSLSFDLANKVVGCTCYLPSPNSLQDQNGNTDWKGLPETWQSVKELKYFPQKRGEIYSAWQNQRAVHSFRHLIGQKMRHMKFFITGLEAKH